MEPKPSSSEKSYRLDFLGGLPPDTMRQAVDLLSQAIETWHEARQGTGSKSIWLEADARRNRARDAVSALADKFAKSFDPSYWAGHSGNDDFTMERVSGFYKASTQYTIEDIDQIKEKYSQRYPEE